MLEEQSQIIQDIDTSNFINKVIEESKNNLENSSDQDESQTL